MSKRFRETTLNREGWFRKLTPVYKCVWDFLCAECDTAGVWDIDVETIKFHIGEEVELKKFIETVNADKVRVEYFGINKLFIPGFTEFQYGKLSEKCIPHQKVITLLIKYNLLDRVSHTLPNTLPGRVKEEEEDKEEEEEKDKRGSGGKEQQRPNIAPGGHGNQELKSEYKNLIQKVMEEPDVPTKKRLLSHFITDKRPDFPEPFADLWNLSVVRHGIAQIEKLPNGRIKKFKTRIKEESFDFIRILTAISESDMLKGKTTSWKVDWDWIFENDTNYIKVMEGKYK